jgi:putative SOS response-associated peptidase YedK
MCGRFGSFEPESDEGLAGLAEEAAALFQGGGAPSPLKTRGEVFPTDVVPVIVSRGGPPGGGPGGAPAGPPALGGLAMRWGFPGFPDPRRPKARPRPLINAKGETALGLKTWKDSALHRRCVVPSAGFYEWARRGQGGKTKFLFRVPSQGYLLMGGVYKEIPLEGGGPFPHFAIITVAANGSVAPTHDRMPLILSKGDLAGWFSPGGFRGLITANATWLERREA